MAIDLARRGLTRSREEREDVLGGGMAEWGDGVRRWATEGHGKSRKGMLGDRA